MTAQPAAPLGGSLARPRAAESRTTCTASDWRGCQYSTGCRSLLKGPARAAPAPRLTTGSTPAATSMDTRTTCTYSSAPSAITSSARGSGRNDVENDDRHFQAGHRHSPEAGSDSQNTGRVEPRGASGTGKYHAKTRARSGNCEPAWNPMASAWIVRWREGGEQLHHASASGAGASDRERHEVPLRSSRRVLSDNLNGGCIPMTGKTVYVVRHPRKWHRKHNPSCYAVRLNQHDYVSRPAAQEQRRRACRKCGG